MKLFFCLILFLSLHTLTLSSKDNESQAEASSSENKKPENSGLFNWFKSGFEQLLEKKTTENKHKQPVKENNMNKEIVVPKVGSSIIKEKEMNILDKVRNKDIEELIRLKNQVESLREYSVPENEIIPFQEMVSLLEGNDINYKQILQLMVDNFRLKSRIDTIMREAKIQTQEIKENSNNILLPADYDPSKIYHTIY